MPRCPCYRNSISNSVPEKQIKVIKRVERIWFDIWHIFGKDKASHRIMLLSVGVCEPVARAGEPPNNCIK